MSNCFKIEDREMWIYYQKKKKDIFSNYIFIFSFWFYSFLLLINIFKVSLNFSKPQVSPGDQVELTVQAAANSSVCLLVVDESVLILQSGFDIEETEVWNGIQNYLL